MKKNVKMMAAVICAAVMVILLAGNVPAAEGEEITLEQVYAMAQKALDEQAIQNVMTRHVMYHCYGLHEDEIREIWVQEPENRATASFAQNQGYYVGYDDIYEGYVASHTTSWLATAKQYCADNNIDIEGWTDEEILNTYGGVGQFMLHMLTTCAIEVASDGQTARCFWYSPGVVAETGDNGMSIWEAYGVDFVKEGDAWKIWHLHMYTDITGNFYIDLASQGQMGDSGSGEAEAEEAESAGPAEAVDTGESGESESEEGESPEGESASEGAEGNGNQGWVPEGGEAVAIGTMSGYLSTPTYTSLNKDRLVSEITVFVPLPYDTWSFDDPNYGLTKEQYEAYGIDLDAWYAAHQK